MDCLDAERLFELFGGPLPTEVEEHIDGCEACRELVAAYARVADEGDTAADAAISPYAPTLASEQPPAAPRPGSAGEVVAERYVLDRVVGEGGMGVVWAARDLRTGQDVALKMLKIETPELTQRAKREAEVAATIGHPNVIEVRDLVALPGAPPILVMPLLEGESLDRLIARRRTLLVDEAIAILLPLVAAVRAAHARGVLHRDLKPQNVFLAHAGDGAPPVVMLLDFGLAKLCGQDVEVLTRTGAIVGTPHYMAPEQLYGERDIDRRADVWAIGAIAYECLTGKRPLEGGSYAQLVRAASRRVQKPLASILPSAPRLAALVDRMLAHDRDDRPEMPEVHALLDAIARRVTA
jgi:eukaryotic-like serine/threonine-protein kinase